MSATAGDCLAPTDVAGLRPAWRLRIRLVPGPFARKRPTLASCDVAVANAPEHSPATTGATAWPRSIDTTRTSGEALRQRTRFRQKESAATGEERDEGENGDHEQHWVDDHAAGDRDDEKHNTENQKHGLELPGDRALQPSSGIRTP